MRRTGVIVAVMLLLSACSSEGGSGSPFGSGPAPSTTTPTGETSTTAGSGGSSTIPPSGGDTTTSTDASTTTGQGRPTETTAAPATTTTEPPTTTTTTLPPTTTTTLPSRPVPLREGLASFDTYEFQMSITMLGPGPGESTQITSTLRGNPAENRRNVIMDSTITTVEDGTSTSHTDMIQVGDRSCSFDGDTWTFQELSAQERELADVSSSLLDLTFATDEGVLVGPEAVAGLPARHYRYSLPGLGQESGALVVENQVDYWVSDDGNVLLKYRALVETRSGPAEDPNTKILRVDTTAELISANQPITIELPAECPVE